MKGYNIVVTIDKKVVFQTTYYANDPHGVIKAMNFGMFPTSIDIKVLDAELSTANCTVAPENHQLMWTR